ncbi:hypothetical protein ACFL6U_10715 [Planctomycetota bacterium]
MKVNENEIKAWETHSRPQVQAPQPGFNLIGLITVMALLLVVGLARAGNFV